MTEDHTPAEPAAEDAVEVRDNPERHRFDILVDGRQAGFSLYTAAEESPDDQRIFHHTVIDDAFEGRGLAGVLTREALAVSVEQGHRIVPVCAYVARWLRGHDDFADSVDRVRPTHLEAVRRANAEADGSAQ
ncbi:GNAT family N-acetyltransferase [Brachybacterium sp. AOP43-C2-M15]|uniref:GNAT family N-acetyltransferase n=1 Tax=Brachybacterium sp. AOP43-C2-M15 TaxID=3457661 RepID=UPI004034E5B3